MAQRRIRRQHRNWTAIIDRLNRTPRGELRIRMGSPGSAQVTRCRLLDKWRNLEAWTESEVLFLERRGRRNSMKSRGRRA